mmetsp:Transcript_4234/g.7650  ORF Transcript_4234/g.7650 Transcript_4234/m.7650 type:complete len:302 (-) Transcript_4234:656-1561(-)
MGQKPAQIINTFRSLADLFVFVAARQTPNVRRTAAGPLVDASNLLRLFGKAHAFHQRGGFRHDGLDLLHRQQMHLDHLQIAGAEHLHDLLVRDRPEFLGRDTQEARHAAPSTVVQREVDPRFLQQVGLFQPVAEGLRAVERGLIFLGEAQDRAKVGGLLPFGIEHPLALAIAVEAFEALVDAQGHLVRAFLHRENEGVAAEEGGDVGTGPVVVLVHETVAILLRTQQSEADQTGVRLGENDRRLGTDAREFNVHDRNGIHLFRESEGGDLADRHVTVRFAVHWNDIVVDHQLFGHWVPRLL